MEIINIIIETYSHFFDLKMWIDLFSNPVSWGLIATLVFMEGLLSADNAIALAVQVKHLPERQRKKALMYGLWGAYLFRMLAIGVGTLLVKLWYIKVIGALYLIFLAAKFYIEYFAEKKRKQQAVEGEEVESAQKLGFLARYIGVFWATVLSVELTDVAFSIDSVLAAFGISEHIGILLIGGFIGILMMRGVAQIFTKLMDNVPELEHTAYIIVGFIGVKMLLTLIDIHISHAVFFGFILTLIALTFVINRLKTNKQ